MLRVAGTTILLLMLAGCAARPRVAVYAPAPGQPTANLVLGPTRDHTFLAEVYSYRSSWPSVQSGYLFDDVSTFSEVIYDDQSYYDGFYGGGFTREAVSVRSGVLVR